MIHDVISISYLIGTSNDELKIGYDKIITPYLLIMHTKLALKVKITW